MDQIIEPVEPELPMAILMKKEEMIELGLRYGLANEKTIECSQQLDDLLNKFTHGEIR
ncbi:aspartyl-phosphate phosphatase Spo0E family protein [Virgibacillus xinjiangensis]|uniref:Aspartyl-phosphate phosphatase Spo0E family protein n=1 Tax=Virgibacillus xinjiangensis TaxID=393090 RepID=A0ABV7CVN8_9BACI